MVEPPDGVAHVEVVRHPPTMGVARSSPDEADAVTAGDDVSRGLPILTREAVIGLSEMALDAHHQYISGGAMIDERYWRTVIWLQGSHDRLLAAARYVLDAETAGYPGHSPLAHLRQAVETFDAECAHGHPIGTACSVCTWFNLTPGYRQAILREHGLVPPSERPPTLRQRLRRWLAKFVPSDDGWRL